MNVARIPLSILILVYQDPNVIITRSNVNELVLFLLAMEEAVDEGQAYVAQLLDDLDDPFMHTVGFEDGGSFYPAGIYGFRPLEAHPQGGKLLATIEDSGLLARYPGRLGLSHSLSIFNGQRSLAMLKYGVGDIQLFFQGDIKFLHQFR